MQVKKLLNRVLEIAEGLVLDREVYIWDVTFEKEGSIWVLTIYIDREDNTAVSIDECEALSKSIDPILDGKEFSTMPAYTLCVSSAGIERKLTKKEHFEKFIDNNVEVGFYKTIRGGKSLTGVLRAYYNDGDIDVLLDGEIVSLDKKDISYVRLTIF